MISFIAHAAADPAPNPWIGPAIIAAVVSGVISLATIAVSASRDRKDRQRQLFAGAFAVCQAYREYPYMVRRRRSDDEAANDRTRLTTGLSEVQRSMNEYRARLRVEAPRVGRTFVELSNATRRIAGAEIKRSWQLPPTDGDDVSITDIDLSELDTFEDAYLDATAAQLSLWPRLTARLQRRRHEQPPPS